VSDEVNGPVVHKQLHVIDSVAACTHAACRSQRARMGVPWLGSATRPTCMRASGGMQCMTDHGTRVHAVHVNCGHAVTRAHSLCEQWSPFFATLNALL
jgi:hypothetical protein